MFFFYCFLIFLEQILVVSTWGATGHSLVARLAQTQLTPTTSNWVSNYLPSSVHSELGRVASWPDSILYPDSNPFDSRQWQWSRSLHYINIPNWNCQYVPMRDCLHDRCIEGALKNYSRRIVDSNNDYIQQQQALFFLVHFIGDIHQPLHTGFSGDLGGNTVKGFFLNSTKLTNLHSIWDVDIIDARIRRHFQSNVNHYFDYLLNLSNNQSFVVNETYTDYQIWIKESVDFVCQQVYLDDDNIRLNVSKNFTLGENYFNRNYPVVDQRLVQAGRRLASRLNQLAQHQSTFKLSPHIQALILFCVLELIVCIFGLVIFISYRKIYARKTDVLLEEQTE